MERMALKATAANAARIHDRGGTVEPVPFSEEHQPITFFRLLHQLHVCLVSAFTEGFRLFFPHLFLDCRRSRPPTVF